MPKASVEFTPCPRCGRKHEKRPGNDAIYYCSHCQIQFDNDPDEGGDYASYDPAWRLQRQERTRRLPASTTTRKPAGGK